MENRELSIRSLLHGTAPACGSLLHEITCGVSPLIDFLESHYLNDYIPKGGSKIKLITGRPGAGKSHFLNLIADTAFKRDFVTAQLNAGNVRLDDFKEFYLAILKQIDLPSILKGCADSIIREMGYSPDDIRPGITFIDYLAERHEADAINKNALRRQLRECFTANPILDNCFAACCSLLTGDLLGYPSLDGPDKSIVLGSLYGEKGIRASQLRNLGISPTKLTRFNARHMLRSLCELVHISGSKGLLVTVDDVEQLLDKSTEHVIRYTKMRREDAYESIRQLIDDIDSMQYVMFFFSFDRELIDDENSGMKSYQALWMRVQNEIVSKRFNSFADILDLDRYADERYTPDDLCEMSYKLAAVLQENGYEAAPIDTQTALALMEASLYGGLGLPYLVNRKVIGGIEYV